MNSKEKPKLVSKLGDDLETTYYLDELAESETWIPKNRLHKYIKSTYLMDCKDYFDLVMHSRGLTNFDRCICGNKLHWLGIYLGYSKTCSPKCRNVVTSKGSSTILIVNNNYRITRVLNQEFLTKYYIPKSIDLNSLPSSNLPDLISYLTKLGCIWIAGFNINSIKYASKQIRNHKLII